MDKNRFWIRQWLKDSTLLNLYLYLNLNTGGFTDLHTASYQSIINGKGYGLKDALPSVKMVKQIRETLMETVNA